jgi:hypothetical protein
MAWWLTFQRYDDAVHEVRAVVEALVAEGVLVAYRLSDGSEVFGCSSGSRSTYKLSS